MSPNCDFPHRCLMPNCNGDFWPKSSISMSMFEGLIILVHLSHVTCQNEPWIEHTILIDDCLIFQLCRGVFQIFFGMPGSLSDFHYFSCIYSYSVLKVVLLQKHWKGWISHSWKKPLLKGSSFPNLQNTLVLAWSKLFDLERKMVFIYHIIFNSNFKLIYVYHVIDQTFGCSR